MADLKTGADAPTLPETLRLKIVYRPIDDLTPYKGNARTHSDKQIAQIAASIRTFGFTNPVLIEAHGQIVAGHGRVAAARLLGMRDVPTIELGHLTGAERRAYVIADNRLAELAGWDREILAIELQALSELDLDFELEITGFETAELDLLLDGVDDADADEADRMPEPGPSVTRAGDIWHLGRHRLICGDARDASVYERLMAGERARCIFTDPPYNVKIDGHVCGSRRRDIRDIRLTRTRPGEPGSRGLSPAYLSLVDEALPAMECSGSSAIRCTSRTHAPKAMRRRFPACPARAGQPCGSAAGGWASSAGAWGDPGCRYRCGVK